MTLEQRYKMCSLLNELIPWYESMEKYKNDHPLQFFYVLQ